MKRTKKLLRAAWWGGSFIVVCLLLLRIDAFFSRRIFNHDPERALWIEMRPQSHWIILLQVVASVLVTVVVYRVAAACFRDKTAEEKWQARERQWAEEEGEDEHGGPSQP